jgi:hypothetical protein
MCDGDWERLGAATGPYTGVKSAIKEASCGGSILRVSTEVDLSRKYGKPRASIFVGAPAPCTSTTAPHTRSERKPTGCWGPNCTMHLAKGLEFRAVAVMACDDEVIPLQSRIEAVADDVDLEEIYNTERHLLYVACTRARDHLLVTSIDPPSEFFDDLRM